jgi:hypothetical protein
LAVGESFRCYGFNPETSLNLNGLSLSEKKSYLLNWSSVRAKFLYCKNNPKGLGWYQEPRVFTEVVRTVRKKRVVETEDYVNGGIALRIYLSDSGSEYYVIDSKERIIVNADPIDPTLLYGSGDCHGNCTCKKCFGGYSNKPDLERGPVRL